MLSWISLEDSSLPPTSARLERVSVEGAVSVCGSTRYITSMCLPGRPGGSAKGGRSAVVRGLKRPATPAPASQVSEATSETAGVL